MFTMRLKAIVTGLFFAWFHFEFSSFIGDDFLPCLLWRALGSPSPMQVQTGTLSAPKWSSNVVQTQASMFPFNRILVLSAERVIVSVCLGSICNCFSCHLWESHSILIAWAVARCRVHSPLFIHYCSYCCRQQVDYLFELYCCKSATWEKSPSFSP